MTLNESWRVCWLGGRNIWPGLTLICDLCCVASLMVSSVPDIVEVSCKISENIVQGIFFLPDNLCSAIGEEDPVLPSHHAPITVLLLAIVEAGLCVRHCPVIVVGHPLVSWLVIADAWAGGNLLGVGGEREDWHQNQGEDWNKVGLGCGQSDYHYTSLILKDLH